MAPSEPVSVGAPRREDRDALSAMAEAAHFHFDLDAELARDHALIRVARETPPGGAVLGFLLAWAVADELELSFIVTRADVRRRGIGKRLLSALVACAVELGARAIHLEVRRSNEAAIALYRCFGFELARVRRAYYATDSEDALEMSLRFEQPTASQESSGLPGKSRDCSS